MTDRTRHEPDGVVERRPRREGIAAFSLGAIPVAALGFADGGFYAKPWSWATIGLAWAAVVVLLTRRNVVISRRLLTLLWLVGALGAWIAVSLIWTRSESLTVPELQRALLYVTGVGVAALIVSERTLRSLLYGVFCGTSATVAFGLIEYLVTRERAPAEFEGYLLHSPMGYANAMAIAAVMAILLALGFIAGETPGVVRTGCAMALIPLSAALVLTGSRAAWGALVVGITVAVVVAQARARTVRTWARVLVAPAVAAGVLAVFDLTSFDLTGERADQLGNRMLAVVAGLTALAALPALGLARTSKSTRKIVTNRRRLAPFVVIVVICAALAGLVLRTPDLSGDRPAYWRVALAEYSEHPLLGTGAGTYHQVWLERRPIDASVRDAHSIVVEAVSELGLVGLLLVLGILGAPLVWGWRARSTPLVPGALSAFAAYAAHASVDWDWEMPTVTLAAILCATALGTAADGGTRSLLLRSRARLLAGVAAGLVGLIASAGLVGASAIESAERSLASGDLASAKRSARRAERWQPWSVEPLLVQGRVPVALNERAGAREVFTRAVQRDPNDYRSWLGLAAVSEGDEAQIAVLRARELNPKAVRSDPADSR